MRFAAWPLFAVFAVVVTLGDLLLARFTAAVPRAGQIDSLPPVASKLELEVIRGDSSSPTPARIYLFKNEEPFRLEPVDVLLPLRVDRFYRESLWRRTTPNLSAPKTLEVTYGSESHFILLEGRGTYHLPAGKYRIEAYRGFAWKPDSVEFELGAGETRHVVLTLKPTKGDKNDPMTLDASRWLSGDDHIHLMRAAEDDPIFLRWLEAEDLSVGNFLQLQRQVDAAVQHGFGPNKEARSEGYSIRAGHESRSEFYGHVNLLGPNELIRPLSIGNMYANSPEAYPFPSILFAQGRAQGAIVGYAHFDGSMNHSTLALDLALGTIDFIEVFQFGLLKHEPWYELLNAGFRVTGVAGSDFPANLPRSLPWPRSIPLLGPERTLVKDFEASERGSKRNSSAYERWAEGVRAGRTVVSNGPLLDLTIDGQELGSKIAWEGESTIVRGVARALFHRPIESIEIVSNGKVVRSYPGDGRTSLVFDFELPTTESIWVAARARCRKQSVDSKDGVEPEIIAHTNPIYVLKDHKPVYLKADRESISKRWEEHAKYYRSDALLFARPEERRALEERIEQTSRILRDAPQPW